MSFTNMPIDTDDDQNLPTKTILNGHVCDTVPRLLSHGAVSFGALRKELEICTGANFGALQGTVDGLVTAFPPSAVGLTRCPPPPTLVVSLTTPTAAKFLLHAWGPCREWSVHRLLRCVPRELCPSMDSLPELSDV